MKKLILYILLIASFNLSSFSDLKKAQEYAQTKIEYPDSDNQDWLQPDYSKFILSQKPSYLKKFLKWIKLEPVYWSPQKFNQKLSELTKSRQSLEEVIYLDIESDAQFIIFGALGGAYHSFVRDLSDLEKKKIINKDLKITENNKYIVFLGNSVGTSPYNMETLYLIMDLIEKNPKQVFYLEGVEEYRENWAERTFGKEIITKGKLPTKNKDSLKKLIQDFFTTLTKALVINLPKSKESILISYFSKPHEKVNPKNKISLEFHSDAPKKEFPENGIIFFKDKDKKVLQMLSSPTRTNKYIYSISNDNYAILTIKSGAKEKFEVCGKNSSSNTPFMCRDEKNLEVKIKEKKEEKTGPIKSDNNNIINNKNINLEKTLLFGSTSDITKSNNVLAIPMKQGLSLKMNKQNREGGIDGKLIQVIFLDDQYTPQFARNNIEKLINEYKTNLILSPIGSPTLAASLDLIKDRKILVLFTNSGSPLFRNPELKNIINFRCSYADEAAALIDYIRSKYSSKRIAFLYQNDEYGLMPLESSIKKLTAMGIDENNILKIPYTRNDINIESVIKKILEFGPDAIGFYALPFIGSEFIRQIGPGKLSNIKLFGISPMGEEGFKNLLKSQGLKMITASGVPNPASTNFEITREYQEDAKSQGIINFSNIYMLEGFINMSLLIEILGKIKKEINMDSIIEASENIKNVEFKGLKLNFNPKNRQLNDKLWLDTGEAEWLEVTIPRD